jgi:excisionase family DNA binding protein
MTDRPMGGIAATSGARETSRSPGAAGRVDPEGRPLGRDAVIPQWRPPRPGARVMDIVDDLELMTVEEVCALLKVRKWFVYDAVSSGRLVGVRLGRALRFRRRDVALFIESGLTAAS